MTPVATVPPQLSALEGVLDSYAGRYRDLNGASNLASYLDRSRQREEGPPGAGARVPGRRLLDEGRRLVERLVCKLYGVPDPLTERVIASAVLRAGSAGAEDE